MPNVMKKEDYKPHKPRGPMLVKHIRAEISFIENRKRVTKYITSYGDTIEEACYVLQARILEAAKGGKSFNLDQCNSVNADKLVCANNWVIISEPIFREETEEYQELTWDEVVGFSNSQLQAV